MTVAQRIFSFDQVGSAEWPGWAQPDGFGAVPSVGEWAVPDQHPARYRDPQPPRRLVLFGLPPVLAEPVTMLAEATFGILAGIAVVLGVTAWGKLRGKGAAAH